MRNIFRLLSITGASVFGFGALTSQAAVLTVGHANTNCPNPQYQTISAAVAAAGVEDTINICPALYPEQIVINKPLTLRGTEVSGIDRVLVQPTGFGAPGGTTSGAVITVVNTRKVTIENLAVDASQNAVSGCDVALAGVHVLNSSAHLVHNACLSRRMRSFG
jgi:pectin methylesterase-like acyl-CoA thioesterase